MEMGHDAGRRSGQDEEADQQDQKPLVVGSA
jgi:hypothetical protein